MKHFYLVLVCLLAPFSGQTQANFKQGLIVNLQGDSLRGFINYQELGGKEPRSLAFKIKEEDKNSREFTPATSRLVDIRGLVTYQSYRGRISMDATSLKLMPHAVDTTKQAVHIYLKVIQEGKQASLFSYTDAIKTRFFLQKQNGPIQELGYKTYYYNNTNNIRTLKNYIGHLWLTATELQMGTPALKKKIESAQYTAPDLIAIVRQLNQLEQQEQQQVKQQKGNTRFFAGLGLARTAFLVEGQHNLASNASSKDSYLPKVSLGLDIFRNPHIQQFFFRGEFILHLATAEISSLKQEYMGDRRLTQTFVQPTATLAPQLGYNIYNRENLKFNLGIGVSLNFSAYAKNIYHTYSTDREDGTVYTDNKIKNHHQFMPLWYAIPIRAGLVLNQKIDISVLYFMPSAISNYLNYSFYRSSLQAGLNYLFASQRK